jgi:exodeoxyribonuclease VII small subunit
MTKKTMEKLSFEQALVRLEEIVGQMEAGEVTLDASLSLFEEGTALSRHCTGKLDAAEERIRVLTDDGAGGIAEQDLDGPADGGGS